MPMYEYVCPVCEEVRTELKSIESMDDCPTCVDCCEVMERIPFSGSDFHLTGEGWTGKVG